MRIRWLLVAVASGLVAALVVGDRITAVVLESLLNDRFGCAGAEVDVAGFPVLTQLWAGTLDEVTVEASRADVRLRLSLTDVSTGADRSVGGVRVDATVPWPVITDRMAENGREVSVEPSGSRLVIVPGGGALTVLATVGVRGGQVHLEPDAVRVLGQEVPLDALGGAAGLADVPGEVTLPVPALPDGVAVTGADVTTEGLVVHAEGSGPVRGLRAGGTGCGGRDGA